MRSASIATAPPRTLEASSPPRWTPSIVHSPRSLVRASRAEAPSCTRNAELQTESGTCQGNCAQAYNIQTTANRLYRIDRTASSTIFTYDDGTTYTAPQTAGELSIMIRTFLADSDLYVYWVRARPLVFPEPALVIGAEKAS